MPVSSRDIALIAWILIMGILVCLSFTGLFIENAEYPTVQAKIGDNEEMYIKYPVHYITREDDYLIFEPHAS